MTRLLYSPRRRRRVGWMVGIAALAGVLTFVGYRWSNTGKSAEAPFTNEPVQTVSDEPQSVAFSGQRRKEVLSVTTHFVSTAVIRRHVDESWDLLAPSLREGFTRKSWSRGDIPVVPYQAEALRQVRSKLDYSYADRVGLRVAIFPKAGLEVRTQTFEIELQDVGPAGHAHWLVSYWAPAGAQGVPSIPADPSGPPIAYSSPKGIGAIWLVLPIAVIGGSIVLLLVSLAVRGWVRRSRAERAAKAFYNSTSSPS